ncbi:unnamed protein product [Prorocentrum cordatum]|uniref:Apple domain-containing protein n=1 Tax=Prorocentrum cordatum TaxID=2364126 RepID=A0ABN9SKZ7_9DINO|nr:unnamed protein product [Polarella glacialis]
MAAVAAGQPPQLRGAVTVNEGWEPCPGQPGWATTACSAGQTCPGGNTCANPPQCGCFRTCAAGQSCPPGQYCDGAGVCTPGAALRSNQSSEGSGASIVTVKEGWEPCPGQPGWATTACSAGQTCPGGNMCANPPQCGCFRTCAAGQSCPPGQYCDGASVCTPGAALRSNQSSEGSGASIVTVKEGWEPCPGQPGWATTACSAGQTCPGGNMCTNPPQCGCFRTCAAGQSCPPGQYCDGAGVCTPGAALRSNRSLAEAAGVGLPNSSGAPFLGEALGGQCAWTERKNSGGRNLMQAPWSQGPDACCARCNEHSDCVAWTFIKGSHECWLKSYVPPSDQWRWDDSAVSSLVRGPDTKCSWEDDENSGGDNMMQAPWSQDPQACCNHCGAHSGCVAWTFIKGSHECWLKSYVPSRDQWRWDGSAISGKLGGR